MWCEHMSKVHEKNSRESCALYRPSHTPDLQGSTTNDLSSPVTSSSPGYPHVWSEHSSHIPWSVIANSSQSARREPGSPQRYLSARPQARLPSPQGSALPSCSAAGCGSLSRSRPQSGLTPACASSSFGGAWAGAELVLLLGQPAWVSLGQDHALPRSPSHTSSCSRFEKSPSFSASLCSSPSCIRRPAEVWTSSLDSLIAETKLSGGRAHIGAPHDLDDPSSVFQGFDHKCVDPKGLKQLATELPS